MQQVTGYELTVRRGPRAGLVKSYKPEQRAAARRFADRLDLEYGAICASVRPVLGDAVPSFTCSPASIRAEHEAELSLLDAQGFALASRQVAP